MSRRDRTSAATPGRASASESRATRVAEPSAEDAAPFERAALALAAALAVLAVLRAALAFVPSMAAWSLNVQRFLPPVLGWGTWALAAVALVPAMARALLPAFTAAGDAASRRPWLVSLAWALGGGLVAWLLPDRVRFVGDFLLRQGTVEEGGAPGVLFPQALPLDVLLHYHYPAWVASTGLTDANGAARLLGALEAAALAALAVQFARVLGLRGVAAFAATCVAWFGGFLCLFTGFSKAFSELVVLTTAVGVFGVRAAREGRGLLALGIAVALGVVLHRSALDLVPAAVLAWMMAARAPGGGIAWRRPRTIAALALPLLAIAVMLPRIIATVKGIDVVHFAPAEVKLQGGPLRAAFSHHRGLDMVNLLLALSPLVFAAVLALATLGRTVPRARELVLLAALAFPLLVFLPFIHPAQGLFRDWDDFAALGAALSLVAAWVVGETLRGARRHAWVGVAVALGVAVPAVQWLAHFASPVQGMRRVEAFLAEPPLRTPAERGTTWDYLGIVHYRREQWDAAGDAFAHAAETAPSPRILEQWAMSETNRGNLDVARDVYHRLLVKQPRNALGWLGLAAVESRRGDVPAARHAAEMLLRLQPGNGEALQILDYLRTREAAPDSARH